ncbi:MAG: ATP-binding protein [Gammaproteobacteria bacterium]
MVIRRPKSLKNLLFAHEIAFLFLVTVSGLVGGLSAYFWQETSSESVRINNLAFLNEQMRGELFRQIQVMIRARVLEEADAVQDYADYSRRIDSLFDEMRNAAETAEEVSLTEDLQASYRVLQKDMNNIFRDPYVTQAVRINILDPRFAEQMVGNYERHYQRFRSLLETEQHELDQIIDGWSRIAPVVIPVLLLLAVLLVLYSRYILKHGFLQPMTHVMSGARQISTGDLEHHIEIRGAEEIASLAAAINHMAADLISSREALIENERQAALGALVPVVAHNIRNPLASIRATAQVLDGSETPAELEESKQAILDTIDRLGRWVSALVSYLHPLQPRKRPILATALINGALAPLKPKLEEKQLQVEQQQWDQDAYVLADPDLMEQALYGLLSNAVEASPAGTTLTIGLEQTGQDNQLRLRLLDSGPGMPFDPKPGNLSPGPSTKRFGTGLGIPIAFKICQAHGWRLEFNVLPGRGTEVLIHAPIASEEISEDEQA